MDKRLIDLYRCKLNDLLDNLKGNHYSDTRLNVHQSCLLELFNIVSNKIESKEIDVSLSSNINSIKEVFDFLLNNIIYLEDSTLNNIPYETIYCLDLALKEWSLNDDIEYIIVTTLRHNNYFFDGTLAFTDNIYNYVSLLFGVDFQYRLIQISIPKRDVNDYMLNGVLYHELGHFVDRKYRITQRIIDTEYYMENREVQLNKYYHLAESFADIFASQYSPYTIQYTLRFLAPDAKGSFTHPSTKDRLELIQNFINGIPNDTTKKLSLATSYVLSKDLKKRFSTINYSDFYNLIPTIVNKEDELHGLFHSVWDIWMNHKDQFVNMDDSIIYRLLNNLIEKSISNYVVQKEWENHAST